MADPKGEGLKVEFDGSIGLRFHDAKFTMDAGLFAYCGLAAVLGLFNGG